MDWKKPGARVILGLLVFCLALDLFTIAGESTAPHEVGRAMCRLHVFDILARILFPAGWSQYVDQACAGFPNEAAISIIAFLLKCTLVMIGLVAIISMFPLREETENRAEDAPSEQKELPGKEAWWFVLFFIFLPAVGTWWFFTRKPPEDFRGSVWWTMLEDIVLLICFGAGLLAWAAFVDLVLLPILRSCFPNGSWLKTR